MSNNFLVVNPLCNNQESDASYAADPLVTNGAVTPNLLPPAMWNKFAFQLSIFVAAFTTMLANKGYSPNDGNTDPSTALAELVSVLTNVMTQADMTPFARLASPAFTGVPTAPTAASNNNSPQLATCAFVQSVFLAMLTITPTSLGFFGPVNSPNIQWQNGIYVSSNPTTISFPTPFPHACLTGMACDGSSSGSCGFQPLSRTQANLFPSHGSTYNYVAIGY